MAEISDYSRGYNTGIADAIIEIIGWQEWLIKEHANNILINEYLDNTDAQQDHDAIMKLLNVIKSKLNKKRGVV